MTTTRRSVIASAAALSAASAAPAADCDVAELVRRAADAHVALVRGDVAAYREQVTLAEDFTLMAPFGGKPSRGGHYSAGQWESIERFFRHGRDSTFELVQACRSSDIVLLAAIERTHVEVGDLAEQDWALRVTLVFRRDGGRWRLAHRHADPLVAGITVEESAALARRTAKPAV